MQKRYVIYKTTNLLNNMIYVGYHATYDINDDYLGSGVLFKKALKEYGKENFKKEILHIFEDKNSAISKESEIVTWEFIRQENNYNLIKGGIVATYHGRSKYKFYADGVFFDNMEDAKKILKITKHKIFINCGNSATLDWYFIEKDDQYDSELYFNKYEILIKNHRKSLSEGCSKRFKGVPKSEEQKEKIRQSNLGRKNEYLLETNKNPEKIEKTRLAHIGMKRSDEAKENMKSSQVKYQEEKRNNKLKADSVIGSYITPKGIFNNYVDAAMANNVLKETVISRCLIKSEEIIDSYLIRKYRKENIEQYRGKTWNELGWNFKYD